MVLSLPCLPGIEAEVRARAIRHEGICGLFSGRDRLCRYNIVRSIQWSTAVQPSAMILHLPLLCNA